MVIVVLRPHTEGKARSEPVLPHDGETDVELVEASSDAGPLMLSETGASGLYVVGEYPSTSANGRSNAGWSENHRQILSHSLELDMPVLALGSGIFLLNEVSGGERPVMAMAAVADARTRPEKPGRRTIYVSPGSKTAAILGAGGFFRFRGEAESPRLTDGRRAKRLLASAYAVEDGAVEGLESAEHSWVLGFRADLSTQEGLPRGFVGIFQSFVERAQDFLLARAVP